MFRTYVLLLVLGTTYRYPKCFGGITIRGLQGMYSTIPPNN